MNAYLALFSAQCKTWLQYRASALAGAGTQVFWGFIRVMIFEAFYHSSTLTQPLSVEQIVTYIWLSQAMLGLLPWNSDSQIRDLIRSGNVVYELARPLDLYFFWYTRSVARRAAPTLLRAIPIFVLAGLFFDLQAPASWQHALAWLAATGGTVLLAGAITALLSISLLWTLAGDGINYIMMAMVSLGSGLIVPLPLFPDWLRGLAEWLPFSGLADAPYRLYMGHIPLDQLGAVLFHQLAWTAVLVLVGRLLLGRFIRRLVVQGG
jgi:ABC-2 type transport system permease protein